MDHRIYHLPVDADLSSKSADWRGRNIWASAPLWSTSTAIRCTTFPWWMVTQRFADSWIFPDILSIVLRLQSCPNNFKFAFAQKNFQLYVPSVHESVSALLSDGYVAIHWPSLSGMRYRSYCRRRTIVIVIVKYSTACERCCWLVACETYTSGVDISQVPHQRVLPGSCWRHNSQADLCYTGYVSSLRCVHLHALYLIKLGWLKPLI